MSPNGGTHRADISQVSTNDISEIAYPTQFSTLNTNLMSDFNFGLESDDFKGTYV
jgi:hypothetical protein